MTYKAITKKSYQDTAEKFAQNVAELAPMGSIEKFIQHLPPQAKVIDIGCGSGRDAHILSERGLKVVGIDFCSNLIEIAKTTAPLAEFHIMDIEMLAFPQNSFEGAWAASSLLHIPKKSISVVFEKIHALLKDKGIFYLSLKKGSGEILEKDARYGDYEKFWSFFEEHELKNLLLEAKFKILELTCTEKYHAYQTHPSLRAFCQKE